MSLARHTARALATAIVSATLQNANLIVGRYISRLALSIRVNRALWNPRWLIRSAGLVGDEISRFIRDDPRLPGERKRNNVEIDLRGVKDAPCSRVT